MTKSESNWLSVLIILVAVSFFYALTVYNSFFEYRFGYVYDPGTDRVFKIELRPSLNYYDKWSRLNPFNTTYFGEVDTVSYIGKLQSTLIEIEEDRKLMINDHESWSVKFQGGIDKIFSDEKEYAFESWSLEYFPRWDVDVNKLLPEKIAIFKKHISGRRPDIFIVDIVIAHSTEKKKMADIEIVRKAVFFRGKAAHELWEMGL